MTFPSSRVAWVDSAAGVVEAAAGGGGGRRLELEHANDRCAGAKDP